MIWNGLDLFCGAGGFSLGAKAAGISIVAANDCWKPAIENYRHNFPETRFIDGDIRDPAVKRRIVAAFDGITCDVIFGGPPCQAYSHAGLRDPNDPRARLFEEFVDVVRLLRPRGFVMENVPGILSMEVDGIPVTDHIRDRFKEIKYTVSHRVLDAAEYGVPQHRLRALFVGTRNGIEITFPAATHAEVR